VLVLDSHRGLLRRSHQVGILAETLALKVLESRDDVVEAVVLKLTSRVSRENAILVPPPQIVELRVHLVQGAPGGQRSLGLVALKHLSKGAIEKSVGVELQQASFNAPGV
jgi:hypothetical protein